MKKLKQVLAQEDTVLFIGSGMSLWSGLPTWWGLIEELARFIEHSGRKSDLIRSEAQRGDLLQAASYGFDKLTKHQIGEFIREACRFGVAKPHDIHKKIVSLGPRCFVTTNYDDLIEQSLRKWQPDRFYKPPITNRHLTETAEIVHARAIDFIFKPHGDAGDSDSIVLTREQYRQLLPQGERHAALESVKMLLASRPVVYLGFGLRDPDFIYLRDLLANTYKGGTRDHYAIMSDVSEAEIDYWLRNYGIHLIGYDTVERPDKSKDHAKLLNLLDTLLEKAPVITEPAPFNATSPEVLLSLARHASALARTPKLAREFAVRVHPVTKRTNGIWFSHDKFDHASVETFLDSGPERSVLIGLPGAGKTYALRRAAARLAENLNQTCLKENFDASEIVVPIFVDLKLYRGSLEQLANQSLPSTLSLSELVRAFKVKVFLDSFNEMPREFWENGLYESDLNSFIKTLGNSSVVIGSRTSDGLTKLDFPSYFLDEIDQKTVIEELQRLGLAIEGRFSKESLRLLQRPFYFQYIASGVIVLPKEAHPRDFYRCFFKNLNDAFTSRFGYPVNLEESLANVAYVALNDGEEAFPIAKLLSVLQNSLARASIDGIQARDVANWLVSRSVLLPYSGSRVAFIHQSVTEYLAATELARKYLDDQTVLQEKLTLTRWDQALFLTLSLLPSSYADLFLSDVIKADFLLALNAVKYLENGRDEIVSLLLCEVPKQKKLRGAYNWKLQSAVASDLPVSELHESELRAIIECGSSLGGAAAARLFEIKGPTLKSSMLQLIFDKRSDYNFCSGIARALKPFASQQDLPIIARWVENLEIDRPYNANNADNADNADNVEENSIGGFISGIATFLSDFDLDAIRAELFPSGEIAEISSIRSKILCRILHEHHSTIALNFASELLLKGVNEATVAIYFIANPNKDTSHISWADFTSEHLGRLQEIAEKDDSNWGIDALKCLCNARGDLSAILERTASTKKGVAKAAFLYCTHPDNLTPVFDALQEIITLSQEDRSNEPLHLLKNIQLDWSGKERLFIELLRIRDERIARSLFGDVNPPHPTNLNNIHIGEIEWWLDWMLEVGIRKDSSSWWFMNQFGSLFANQLNLDQRNLFIAEFNRPNSKYRNLLLHCVIPYFKDLTSDSFDEDTISFLLADLNRAGAVHSLQGHVLGFTATERFIVERILPLLPQAQPPLVDNLHAVLNQAGPRHGRRYVLGDSGQ
jgi:hypothetical protein